MSSGHVTSFVWAACILAVFAAMFVTPAHSAGTCAICTDTCDQLDSVSTSLDSASTYDGLKVIYINIDGSYDTDMARGYTLLSNDVAVLQSQYPGINIELTYHTLNSGNPIPSLDDYDQVWVVDLSTGSDASSTHISAYDQIEAWWNAAQTELGRAPGLILDGRIISSLWYQSNSFNVGCGTIGGNFGRPNQKLIGNYFRNLARKGKGLFLGTDHSTRSNPLTPSCSVGFTAGIDSINSRIGVGPFTGCYYATDYVVVDTGSTLIVDPEGHHASFGSCGGNEYLWDDSSTSVPPSGLQPNGVTLYPVAWHGNNPNSQLYGITANFVGTVGFIVSITFGTEICGHAFQPGETVPLTGEIVNDGGATSFDWDWYLDDSTTAFATGETASIDVPPQSGHHTIKAVVTNNEGIQTASTVCFTVGEGTFPDYIDGSGERCDMGFYGFGCQCQRPQTGDETSLPNSLNIPDTQFSNDVFTLSYFENIKYRSTCSDPNIIFMDNDGNEDADAETKCYSKFTWSVVEPTETDESDCSDRTWTGTISVSDFVNGAAGCLHETIAVEDAYTDITYRFAVQNYETTAATGTIGSPIYLERSVTHLMPFTLRFNTEIAVSSGNERVFSKVVSATALVESILSSRPSISDEATAKVVLFTSVQYPFKLVNPVATQVAGGLTGGSWTVAAAHNSARGYACEDVAGQDCVIAFEWTITDPISSPVCSFTGSYQVRFDVECVFGASGCPVDDEQVFVSFDLESSANHCPTVVDTTEFSSSLSTYTDNSYLTEYSSFIEEDTIYAKAFVSSPDVSLASVQWNSIVISGGTLGSDIALITDGSIVADSAYVVDEVGSTTVTDPTLYQTQFSEPTFSFKIPKGALNVQTRSTASFTLTAVLDISYSTSFTPSDVRGSAPLRQLRRSVAMEFKPEAFRSASQDVEAAVSITSNDNEGEKASQDLTSASNITFVGVAAVAFVALIAAVFAVSRYPRKSVATASASESTTEQTESTASSF